MRNRSIVKELSFQEQTAISLHIVMRISGPREDGQVEHELHFGVVGADNPATVNVVSEGYLRPIISARGSRGGLRLRDELFDALALKCFRLMAGLLLDEGGKSGWWTIADVTKFIRNQFANSEATEVLRELSRYVKDRQSEQDVCLVADDNSI